MSAFGVICAPMECGRDGQGPALTHKPTGFLTNSMHIARRVGVRCKGGHRHIHLMNGRASTAAVHPTGLSKAIVTGLQEEIDHTNHDQKGVLEKVKVGRKSRRQELQQTMNKIGKHPTDKCMQELVEVMHYSTHESEPKDLSVYTVTGRRSRRSAGGQAAADLMSFTQGSYWDDVRGGWLGPELVKKGRTEEIGYARRHKVYKWVPLSVCYAETGKAPLRTGWVDTNKGTADCPNVRCRWVAKEFNKGPAPGLFAPTPPLEGIKLVLSQAASTGRSDTVVLIVDVRRAYFYAPAERRVFVQLPVEDWVEGDEHMCGLLLQSLYGTRDAAKN